MAEGVHAAREHRAEAHAGELPERSPDPRAKRGKKPKRDRVADERRERVIAVLREAERPLTASEIGQAVGMSPAGVSALLGRWMRGLAVRIGRPDAGSGRWWLSERGDPPAPY